MSTSANDEPFHLAIDVLAPSRFEALERFFAALKRAKARQFEQGAPEPEAGWDDPDSAVWASLLDDEAREHVARAFDYTSEEGRAYVALWNLTEPANRRDPIFEVPGPWELPSMVAGVLDAELLLTELRRIDPRRAVLRYEPLAGPFGGTEPLVQIVEAFGQQVVHDSWHEGPHRRAEVGWDYDRAKRLVAQGRGIE